MTDLYMQQAVEIGNLAVSNFQGEARIRDLDLANRLGFEDPHKIRTLIERHASALAALGVSATVAETAGAKGGRPGKAYYLNRKQAIFITAKSDTPNATEITIEIIERFDAYERGEGFEAHMMKALGDPAAVRGMLLHYTEKVLELQGQVAEMAPKVEALDRIATADGSMCITNAAKVLSVRPKDLFAFLRSHHWIYRRPGSAADIGYAPRVATGDLDHKITTVLRGDGTEKVVEQVRITPQGLAKLAKLVPVTARLVAEAA